MSPYRRPFRWAHRHRSRINFLIWATGTVLAGLWLIVLTGRINRVEATRVATIQASYNACVLSIPFAVRINEFVKGAETVADVLLVNARATHAVTPPGTPMYEQQKRNIARLRHAINAGEGVRIPVPTKAVCKARRDKAL